MSDTDQPSTKSMVIAGTHNKYMIKKITSRHKNNAEKRNIATKMNLDPEWYTTNFQLKKLAEHDAILKQPIVTKISSYKHQDDLKKRYDSELFVDYTYVCGLLTDTCMHCHYCNEDMYVLYEHRRDMQQWTLDRINNDIGHNKENVVVACLKCNLQRKTRDANKFLDTKQLVIKREGID